MGWMVQGGEGGKSEEEEEGQVGCTEKRGENIAERSAGGTLSVS